MCCARTVSRFIPLIGRPNSMSIYKSDDVRIVCAASLLCAQQRVAIFIRPYLVPTEDGIGNHRLYVFR
jgi:hypothetical protein